jgi:sterol desaturase/sphingolipid hydroxylase (fatty acid hydroxylase superfamily)
VTGPFGQLLERLWATVTPYALAVSLPQAVALLAVTAEVAWLARRPGPRRRRVLSSAATASVMALGAVAVGVAYTGVFTGLWELMARARNDTLADFWTAQPVIGAVATFVAWDLAGWIYHLIGHRTAIGWAAHGVHHSGPDYDATLGLRQTWFPFHGLAHQPLLALAGFDLRVVFVCAALSNGWQMVVHTSLPVRFPHWVEAVVNTPASHRHHHGTDRELVNLAPCLTVWDRLAGSWVSPGTPAPTAYGPRTPAPANPLRVEVAGYRALASGLRCRWPGGGRGDTGAGATAAGGPRTAPRPA